MVLGSLISQGVGFLSDIVTGENVVDSLRNRTANVIDDFIPGVGEAIRPDTKPAQVKDVPLPEAAPRPEPVPAGFEIEKVIEPFITAIQTPRSGITPQIKLEKTPAGDAVANAGVFQPDVLPGAIRVATPIKKKKIRKRKEEDLVLPEPAVVQPRADFLMQPSMMDDKMFLQRLDQYKDRTHRINTSRRKSFEKKVREQVRKQEAKRKRKKKAAPKKKKVVKKKKKVVKKKRKKKTTRK
jgi:hypothetical protein